MNSALPRSHLEGFCGREGVSLLSPEPKVTRLCNVIYLLKGNISFPLCTHVCMESLAEIQAHLDHRGFPLADLTSQFYMLPSGFFFLLWLNFCKIGNSNNGSC